MLKVNGIDGVHKRGWLEKIAELTIIKGPGFVISADFPAMFDCHMSSQIQTIEMVYLPQTNRHEPYLRDKESIQEVAAPGNFEVS